MAYSSCPRGLETYHTLGKPGDTYSPCSAVFSRAKGPEKVIIAIPRHASLKIARQVYCFRDGSDHIGVQYYAGLRKEKPTVNDDNHTVAVNKERCIVLFLFIFLITILALLHHG